MTEDQVQRARDLIHTRDAIRELLSTRDAQSGFNQDLAKSEYEFQRRAGEKLLTAGIVEIHINDATECSDDDPTGLGSWMMLRDVLEHALAAELPRIEAELLVMGITPAP